MMPGVVSLSHGTHPVPNGTMHPLVQRGNCGRRGRSGDLDNVWPFDRLGERVPDGEAWAVAAAEVVDGRDEVKEPGAALVERL